VPPRSVLADRWRPTPARLVRLVPGLVLFGLGESCLVDADLGVSPWTVLAQGISEQSGIALGTTTILLSFVVLLLWVPLRQLPGLGTVGNAVLVGLTIDVALGLLPSPDPFALQVLEVLVGIGCVAVGSGLYLTARLGPGPRDGLMTGLHRRFGVSIRAARLTLEVSVCVVGVLLGGTFGLGTVAFALLIGPAVQLALEAMGARGRTQEL
jgi:uncharacterized membrane protein YczE